MQSFDVTKSPHDHRLYRRLQLENGLQALLISDPEIQLPHERDEDSPEHSNSDGDDESDNEEEGLVNLPTFNRSVHQSTGAEL